MLTNRRQFDSERLIDAVQRVLHKRAAVVGMNE